MGPVSFHRQFQVWDFRISVHRLRIEDVGSMDSGFELIFDGLGVKAFTCHSPSLPMRQQIHPLSRRRTVDRAVSLSISFSLSLYLSLSLSLALSFNHCVSKALCISGL